uniref:Uncharacterized protein n=1 Tax=Anguilla anguilla TaxID=7936 RepID=A0A0E9UMF3_ANGAN
MVQTAIKGSFVQRLIVSSGINAVVTFFFFFKEALFIFHKYSLLI